MGVVRRAGRNDIGAVVDGGVRVVWGQGGGCVPDTPVVRAVGVDGVVLFDHAAWIAAVDGFAGDEFGFD